MKFLVYACAIVQVSNARAYFCAYINKEPQEICMGAVVCHLHADSFSVVVIISAVDFIIPFSSPSFSPT